MFYQYFKCDIFLWRNLRVVKESFNDSLWVSRLWTILPLRKNLGTIFHKDKGDSEYGGLVSMGGARIPLGSPLWDHIHLKKVGSWVSMAVTFSFWPLRQGTYPSHSLLKPLDYFPSIQLNMYKRTYFSESHSPVLGLKICKIWLAQPLTPVFACIVCHFWLSLF